MAAQASKEDGGERIASDLSDVLSRYVERHPGLRDDFILVAREDEAGDLVIVTVGDVADGGATGAPQDERTPRSVPPDG